MPDLPIYAFDIATFCKTHHISRTSFWRMQQKGIGPRLMKVGRRTLISIEAAEEWRRSLEVAC